VSASFKAPIASGPSPSPMMLMTKMRIAAAIARACGRTSDWVSPKTGPNQTALRIADGMTAYIPVRQLDAVSAKAMHGIWSSVASAGR
jgi:hypothetical protein